MSEDKPKEEDVRAEYAALCSYHNAIVGFRFTLLGFFVATVGFMLGGDFTPDKAFLLLALTVAMYVIELRNRVLYFEMTKRAMQIEREHWGYKGQAAYEPLFCYMAKVKPDADTDAEAPEPPPYNHPQVWGRKLPWLASHSKGLDILYCAVAVYALAHIVGYLLK